MSVKPADHRSSRNVGEPDELFVRQRDQRETGIDTRDEELWLLDRVRERLDLGADVSDVTIAASLAAIAANSDTRGRWLAAFGSPLGRWLASRGRDLNTTLNTLIAMTPRPH